MVDLKSGELVLKVTLLYGLHSEDLGVSIDDVVDPTVDGCLHSGGIGGSLCTFVGFLVGALSLGNTLLLIDSGNLSVDAGLDCSDILRAHNKDVSRDDAWNLCGDRREILLLPECRICSYSSEIKLVHPYYISTV